MQAARPAADAGAVWLQAYATGTMGNALMLTHFVTQREQNALGLQLLGIASNLLVLSQVPPAWRFHCSTRMWLLCSRCA
jgi:hypothetical protein